MKTIPSTSILTELRLWPHPGPVVWRLRKMLAVLRAFRASGLLQRLPILNGSFGAGFEQNSRRINKVINSD